MTAWGRNPWLIVAGWLSIGASLLHIGCISADQPGIVLRCGRGDAQRPSAGKSIGAAYLRDRHCARHRGGLAFAGAGVFRKLPLTRTALVVITAVYMLRGLMLIPIAFTSAAQTPFNIWSSLIVLGYGIFYAVGTWKAWPSLSMKEIV